MKSVGIKRLKAQLSEYVRMAKAGETILVTERDEVVAELRPARRQLGPRAELEELFDELAEYHCPACDSQIAIQCYPTLAEAKEAVAEPVSRVRGVTRFTVEASEVEA